MDLATPLSCFSQGFARPTSSQVRTSMIPLLNNAHYPAQLRIIYAHTHAGYMCTNTRLCVVCKQSVLPLVVRYIKSIYSWTVHPARRRRTHSITVTVRSAHSMASTCGSDSPPVSSACKAQRWYESQPRRLNNEGENFFPRFARTDRRYAPLCTCQSICFLWP